MFQPARRKRAIVASCKLPLGMPSLNLLATIYLFLIIGFLDCSGRGDWLGEATDRALVAYQSVALDDHAKEQRIVVAVGCGGDDAQVVAAGFALHPQLLAGAAPKGDEAGLQGFCVADGVEKAEHQHLAGARILHNAGREAVHLVKINCGVRIVHCFPWFWSFSGFWSEFVSEREKARWLSRRRALDFFDLSGRLHQAIAVRRHGVSMMMVVTVMAVALHLLVRLRESRPLCQIFSC